MINPYAPIHPDPDLVPIPQEKPKESLYRKTFRITAMICCVYTMFNVGIEVMMRSPYSYLFQWNPICRWYYDHFMR